jgi:hypothetical protein
MKRHKAKCTKKPNIPCNDDQSHTHIYRSFCNAYYICLPETISFHLAIRKHNHNEIENKMGKEWIYVLLTKIQVCVGMHMLTLRLQSIQLRELAIDCEDVPFSMQVSGPDKHRKGTVRGQERADRVLPLRTFRWLWIAREWRASSFNMESCIVSSFSSDSIFTGIVENGLIGICIDMPSSSGLIAAHLMYKKHTAAAYT